MFLARRWIYAIIIVVIIVVIIVGYYYAYPPMPSTSTNVSGNSTSGFSYQILPLLKAI